MKKVATIGSRATPINILAIMEKIGAYLVDKGYVVASGNAVGADQAFARGANTINPKRVHLYLPWASYEAGSIHSDNTVYPYQEHDWFVEAANHHPNWANLKDSVKKLMARNIGIVENSCQVVCWMDPKNSGGTGHGYRYAVAHGVPILNLYDHKDLAKILEKINAPT